MFYLLGAGKGKRPNRADLEEYELDEAEELKVKLLQLHIYKVLTEIEELCRKCIEELKAKPSQK